MPKLWVREKWRARKRCNRENCEACQIFWIVFAACAGGIGANSYFAMNHRWTDLHREYKVKLVAQKKD